MASWSATVEDEIVIEKVRIIERCLDRVREEFGGDPARLENHTIEDALVLNLQRACEAAIDLAMHAVRLRRLGLPHESREAFSLLEAARILDPSVADRMRKMVGFRNIVVHAYQDIDRARLVSIVQNHLEDFVEFCKAIVRFK